MLTLSLLLAFDSLQYTHTTMATLQRLDATHSSTPVFGSIVSSLRTLTSAAGGATQSDDRLTRECARL